MIDFDSVLKDANQFSTPERLRLIDALWDSVPADAELPVSEEWASELERRVAAIQQGTMKTVSWDVIRTEALGGVALR